MSRAVPGPQAPALYEATITHQRRQRIDTEFAHRAYLWLVDLDALPQLPWWLRPFARFEARDHLGDPTRSIRENLVEWLAEQGVDLGGGRVLMLANARVLGHVFNPLTVYWCHGPDGEPRCVVAEVHNTYGERHRYLLRPDERGRAGVGKQFYVSPFLEMHGEYRMCLPRPDDTLFLSVALHQDGALALSARVQGRRTPATRLGLIRMLARFPLMPQRVSLLIRRHGIALWLRRIPIVPRPQTAAAVRRPPQDGAQ